MSKPKRIYQIAIELNISHSDIIDFLDGIGEKGYGHMSEVSSGVYSKIISKYSKDKKRQEVYAKEKARNTAQTTRAADIKKTENEKLEKKPAKKLETRIGLKIIEMPSEEDRKASKERQLLDKTGPAKDTANKTVPKKKTSFKKINIAEIADKISQNKKNPNQNSNKLFSKNLNIASSKKKKRKKIKKNIEEVVESSQIENILVLPEFSTLEELANSMNVKVQDAIMKALNLGMVTTINQRLDIESMIMIADEFGFEIKEANIEEDTSLSSDQNEVPESDYTLRAPVVTVMGHVDHGKTSFLDYIRTENVVSGESGGITQHIGAYKVEVQDGKFITFLDTPGHAAFTAMRSRGSKITDIVVLVIAADDDVMPQTIEAIDHAQAASVPIIIAINKIDLPAANVDKILKQLSEKNILVEDWGGKYQYQPISSKTGENIDKLLDKILLEAEVSDLKAPFEGNAVGVVVESKLDKGLGPIATVLVQKGVLKKGDIFNCGSQSSKVRSLLDQSAKPLIEAFPADPVQVLGFESVPNAGDVLSVHLDEKESKRIASKRSQHKREAEHRRFKKTTLEQIGKEISEGAVKDLNVLIKGDVDGSIEALSDSLMSISTDEVNVKIIHRSVGTVNETDISLAKASNAVIITFNLNTPKQIKAKAKENGVDIRSYSIIYEAINEIKLALEGLLEPDKVEDVLGLAEVRDSFKVPKIGIVAGCYITKGKAVKNAFLRVKRKEEVIHEGNLTSLKRFKDDVSEVQESYECGIGVDGFSKFENGDIIEIYEIKEIKRTL